MDIDDFYPTRLAEPELLERAIRLPVQANQDPIAVPVGKFRRGGHIEFLKKSEARKALKLLAGREGFPNVRVVGDVLYWGDPRPTGDQQDMDLLFGVYYGYSEEAILEHAYLSARSAVKEYRKPFNRKRCLSLIRSARNKYLEK